MARVAERVSDKRVKLIRAFLKAGVMEDLIYPVDEGTPQGGPLSPLLSNLVLDELDKELTRRGHRFCRYADGNIYVRSQRAGERVMASVARFRPRRYGSRSTSQRARSRDRRSAFLGFSIANDGSERRIAPALAIKALVPTRADDRNEAEIGGAQETTCLDSPVDHVVVAADVLRPAAGSVPSEATRFARCAETSMARVSRL